MLIGLDDNQKRHERKRCERNTKTTKSKMSVLPNPKCQFYQIHNVGFTNPKCQFYKIQNVSFTGEKHFFFIASVLGRPKYLYRIERPSVITGGLKIRKIANLYLV